MPTFPRNTAKILQKAWSVEAEQVRFRSTGDWYHPLADFPAAYFDRYGYIRFTKGEYQREFGRDVGSKDVHVPGGIGSLHRYVRMALPATPERVRAWALGKEVDRATPETSSEQLDTEFQRLVWLRTNQARFSTPVKEHWGLQCALTEVGSIDLLQACHIKPFAESNDGERLDEFNGICLAAHVHAAFDVHLIGISPDGEVQYSPQFSAEDRRKMNLPEKARIRVKEGHRRYLEHRHAKFREKNP